MKQVIALLIAFVAIQANAHNFNVDIKEPLLGYMAQPDKVSFQVFSGGCTHKEDFRVQVENFGEFKQITLFRQRRDECLAFFPLGKIISFSYSELGLNGGDRFVPGNSIAPSVVW